MTHFFIHNSFRNGDVILTRAIIHAIRISFLDIRITLECTENCVYLWRDLELPILVYQNTEYKAIEPTPNCPDDAIFINLWFGVYEDILTLYGMTYPNNVHTFNRQMYQHNIHHKYLLAIPIYTPMITFFGNSEQEFEVKGNSIVVENGKALSNQNYFYLNEHLEQIASDFTNLNFYCSAKLSFTASNVFDCSELNLTELSHIGNKCIGFLMKGSAVNAATQTEINRYKPRCIVGWDLPMKVWDNLENPTAYAENYAEVKEFLSTVDSNFAVQKTAASSTAPQVLIVPSLGKKPQGIFLNTAKANCSIYESGKMAYQSLLLSDRYGLDYLEIDQKSPHIPNGYDFYFFNYHHATMGWLNTKSVRQLSGVKVTLVLETLTNNPFVLCPSDDFDAYCTLDPTMNVVDKRVYAFPRPLETPATVIPYRQPAIPIIGSFGFATPGKGFELVVDAVNKEFDEAIVKINIPPATYADDTFWKLHKRNYADYLSELCRKVAKNGVQVIVSYDYINKGELIEWCSQNTLNCFLYNRNQPGLSATTDQAVASGRPLAVSANETFRHIHPYIKPYPFQNLKESIASSQPQVIQMQKDWASTKFAAKFEEVLEDLNLLSKTERKQIEIKTAEQPKDTILIVSHKEKQCGIYQYGVNIAEALQKSSRYSFIYAECSNQEELHHAVVKTNPAAIIYNYYLATMPWLRSQMTRGYSIPQLGIMHEVTQEEADKATQELFDYHLCPDPTLLENNPIILKTRRLIPSYVNHQNVPDVVTIGSFGFGFGDKGFERLVGVVQQEFEQAKIVLHLPFNDIVDKQGQQHAIATANRCRSVLLKPGIQLVINHEFLSKQQLLSFLASNTLNAFLYDTHKHRGISSVIENALAVQRPIAVTKCGMFRHILSVSPSICIEDSSLIQIINSGTAPLVPFYNEWSEHNFILNYECIFDKLLGGKHGCYGKSTQVQQPHLSSVESSLLPIIPKFPSSVIDMTIPPLSLTGINLIMFPDWSGPEESLGLELGQVIKALLTHPDKSCMTLLLDTSNIADEDANLILSSVMMNLFMQEDSETLDVDAGLEISFVGPLSAMQREALLPHIRARIALEHENQQAITYSKAESLPLFSLLQDSHRGKSIQVQPHVLAAVTPSVVESEIREIEQAFLRRKNVKIPVLFVNYKVENCGVHQYGKNIFNALSTSKRYIFHYADISSIEELDTHVLRARYDAIIYNYHPQTLTFINPHMSRRYEQVNIAVMHEMSQLEADIMPNNFFQCYVMGDPTLIENNPVVFKTGRLVIPYTNTKKIPDTVTIGTFGFSVGSKGYQRLIDAVQNEFDEAIVRIHIPSNGVIDPNGRDARQHIKLCQQKIRKPGIKIQASHEFLDRNTMLDFLAENTLNAFLYDYLKVAGISSSIDHAMAVHRPIAITKSIMFRQLLSLNPPITVEDISLKEIIRNGTAPFDHFYKLWSEQNIMHEYECILDKTLNIAQPTNFKAVKKFNRILDNEARVQYKHSIEKLFALVPEMMKLKIPEANVQQAFVLDTVEKFALQYISPRILCVGSYEDTAAASLKELGYQIQEVDPVLNNLDLDTFFHLPSTVKGNYDIILSTSVIEHVQDDELFLTQIVELLAPGGVAVLTCDYNDQHKPESPVIQGDYRFYTQKDLILRVLPLLKDCSLVDVPHWDCPNPDFVFAGYRYTFATLVFQKHMIEQTILGADRGSIRAGSSMVGVGSTANDLVIQANWATMSALEQRTFFAENGFLVVSEAISADEITKMHLDIQGCGFAGTIENFWSAPSFTTLIDNSKVLAALQSILGPDVRFFKGAYVAKPPIELPGMRLQRQELHVDYGIGESIGDFRNSCSSWINVGYYLTNLTLEHGPFWVVPGSNRNYHIAPGTDMEYMTNEARIVLAKAGDAIFFHCSTVHAVGVNVSNYTRHALFFSYRPAWARPIGPVPEWPKEFVDNAPPERKRLLLGLNKGF